LTIVKISQLFLIIRNITLVLNIGSSSQHSYDSLQLITHL